MFYKKTPGVNIPSKRTVEIVGLEVNLQKKSETKRKTGIHVEDKKVYIVAERIDFIEDCHAFVEIRNNSIAFHGKKVQAVEYSPYSQNSNKLEFIS